MATINTELALVKRFHSLLQNYDSRPAVARRNTLPTLTRFLKSKDRDTRKLSLEAVLLLAEHPENVDLLGQNKELVGHVVEVYQLAQYDDPELCELASNVLDHLSSTFVDGDPRLTVVTRRAEMDGGLAPSPTKRGVASKSVMSDNSTLYNKEMVNTMGSYENIVSDDVGMEAEESSVVSGGTAMEQGSSVSRGPPRSTQFAMPGSALAGGRPSDVIRGAGRDCPLSVVLEIPALDGGCDTTDLEEILQTTRGVISYTITASAHQIRVFLSAFAQRQLQDALTDAGYENMLSSAERLMQQDAGVSNRSFDNSFFYDEEQKKPSYLENARSFASSLFSAVMVYRDPQSNSLAARVRQQRNVEDEGGSRTADKVAQAFARWW